MTHKRLLTTALISLSVLTVGLSEAKAAQVSLRSDLQEPQLVALKFKKFGHHRRGFRRHHRFQRRHHGFKGHSFRRSPSFGHKKFKVIKKRQFDHDQKHHDQKFHRNRRGFFR